MADKIQLYEDQPIRTAWVEDEEEWYFSIVDVVGVLTEQTDYQKARKYWNKLKQRLSEEGSQLVTNCHGLKMTAQDVKDEVTRAWSGMSTRQYKNLDMFSYTTELDQDIVGTYDPRHVEIRWKLHHKNVNSSQIYVKMI